MQHLQANRSVVNLSLCWGFHLDAFWKIAITMFFFSVWPDFQTHRQTLALYRAVPKKTQLKSHILKVLCMQTLAAAKAAHNKGFWWFLMVFNKHIIFWCLPPSPTNSHNISHVHLFFGWTNTFGRKLQMARLRWDTQRHQNASSGQCRLVGNGSFQVSASKHLCFLYFAMCRRQNCFAPCIAGSMEKNCSPTATSFSASTKTFCFPKMDSSNRVLHQLTTDTMVATFAEAQKSCQRQSSIAAQSKQTQMGMGQYL